jgi:adenosylcobyric acid synthase
MMQDRLQKPCLGVVPYIHHLALEEEDSLGLADITRETEPWLREDVRARRLRIAVVELPSFSNFTDFDALRHEPSVSLRFCREPLQLALADLIILPGSKQTVEDLLWMRHQDMDSCVVAHAAQGLIVGICGGMQMLGTAIVDSLAMEHGGQADALGLLPFTTHMNPDKVTRAVTGRLSLSMLFGQPVPEMDIDGYEIHIGETMYAGDARTFSILNGREPDGCISPDTRIFGTYLHGIFDDDKFRHTFLAAARSFHQLAPVDRFENWRQKREDSFNRLADTVRESLDLPRIFDWVGISYKSQGQIEPMEQIR